MMGFCCRPFCMFGTRRYVLVLGLGDGDGDSVQVGKTKLSDVLFVCYR